MVVSGWVNDQPTKEKVIIAVGNAGRYPIIFEANKPMLAHPDKIYPGQVLRIPALGADGKPID